MSYNINNRRYTGSKYKLINWIDEIIKDNCSGDSFCDLFGGTGVVLANEFKNFNKNIINDFLYSNNVIYNAFFYNESYKLEKLKDFIFFVNNLNSNDISNNYFSENFGNKYFSYNDSKKIGFIRDYIETNKSKYNFKEYNILLAGLIYSIDKIANTVGHYDAFIKNKLIKDKFQFDIIMPYNTENNIIEIYKEDANVLAKKIHSDIVYIDPPYNSRQYSRFYHVLETLVKNTKEELFGVAKKPIAENMSDYCRENAKNKFSELIKDLQCKYIVLSYNNTYNSKSSSSKNKIDFETIVDVLEKKGKLKIFFKEHKYFNSGNTEFTNHKEFLFVTEVI